MRSSAYADDINSRFEAVCQERSVVHVRTNLLAGQLMKFNIGYGPPK